MTALRLGRHYIRREAHARHLGIQPDTSLTTIQQQHTHTITDLVRWRYTSDVITAFQITSRAGRRFYGGV